jgi:ferritin-like metal-binding protein YciE
MAKDRDSKLVQYLNEAYGKEKELEAALEAHIGMTTRAPYKKRLQQHLRETKGHARQLERRIKQLGGDTQTLQRLAGQATAALKGPLHALRGTGEDERLLKNAKTEYSEEAEEIATYTAIEAFAENVSDRETAKLARAIKREEERMASYLERLIPQLTRAVVRAEVPSDQRSNGRTRSRRTSSRSSSSRSSSSSRRSGSSGSRRRSTTKSKSRSGSTSSRRRSTTQSRARSRSGSSRRGSQNSSRSSRSGTRSPRSRSRSRTSR